MDLFKQLFVLGLIAVTTSVSGQISSGKVEDKKPADEPKPATERRIPTDGIDEFCFYLGAGRVYSNRSLDSNQSVFGASLGERAKETGLKTMSFQIGLRNRLSTYFSYDIGLALDRVGESYAFDDPNSDSAFSYTSRYTYYALPLQGLATFGKDFRFFIGGGLQPQLLAGFRQEQKWTTVLNSNDDATVKSTDGFNQFGLAALATCGIQWRMSKRSSIYVLPTWTWNLLSTYDDQADYVHKSRSFNVKFGFVFHLKQ